MSLKGRRDLTPIAVIDIDDWELIRSYCKRHDVLRGGDYDCPYGGAINIWTQKGWQNPAGELHGSYYPDCSETNPGMINVYFMTGGYLNENQERPWETDDIEYDFAGNWSPWMGKKHFNEIYRKAVGGNYFLDIGEFLSLTG